MVCQYKSWPCPACGARVTDLSRPEALAPEHRVCERCWRKAARDAAYAALRDAPEGTPAGELSRRNDALIAADRAYRQLLRGESAGHTLAGATG